MDNLNFEHMYGQWGKEEMKMLDDWFDSPHWKQVVQLADQGHDSCTVLMERVSDMLGSLIFHLENESGQQRVSYELGQFKQLLNQFEHEQED